MQLTQVCSVRQPSLTGFLMGLLQNQDHTLYRSNREQSLLAPNETSDQKQLQVFSQLFWENLRCLMMPRQGSGENAWQVALKTHFLSLTFTDPLLICC